MVNDKDIERVQKSTRTLFAPLIPLHNKLRMKYSWYYNWHLWKYSKSIHLALLFCYIIVLSSFGLVAYKATSPKAVRAEDIVKAYQVSGLSGDISGINGYYIGTGDGPYDHGPVVSEIHKVGSDWLLGEGDGGTNLYKTSAATPDAGGWTEAITPAPTVTANGANYIVSGAGLSNCNGEYTPYEGGYILGPGLCRLYNNSGWDLTDDYAIWGGPKTIYHTDAGSPDGGGWSVVFDPGTPTVVTTPAYMDVSAAGFGDANGTYIIDGTSTWTWGKPGYIKGDWSLDYVSGVNYYINGPGCFGPGCYLNDADTPTGGIWDMFGHPGSAPTSVTISGSGYLVAGAGLSSLNGQYDSVGGGHYSNGMYGGDGDLSQDTGVWYIGGMAMEPPKTYSNPAATPDQGSWSVVNAPAPTVAEGSGPEPTPTPTPTETPTVTPTSTPTPTPNPDPDCVVSSGSGRDDMTSGTWGTKVVWGDGAYRCTAGNCLTVWRAMSGDVQTCQGPYIWKNGGNWRMTGCLGDGLAAYESSVGLVSQWDLSSWDAPPPLVEQCVAPTPTPTPEPPAGITISGTARRYDESTNAVDGEVVKVAVNGVLQVQTGVTGTPSAGTWVISSVTAPSSGDVITVFIDGAADASEANAITKYDGTGDITGIDLYEKHLSIGSDDNRTLSNINISSYDNSVSSDEDIFFDVDGSNNLTLPVAGTQTDADQKLIVKTGNSWRPSSSEAITSTVPKLFILDGAYGVLNDTTLRLTGSGQGSSRPLKVGTTGSLDTGTSTVIYQGSSATDIAAIGFYNLALNRSGTTFTPFLNFSVAATFTIESGSIYNGLGKTVTLSGSTTPFVINGTFTPATSTIKYTGSSATNITGTTYYNLSMDHSGTTFTAAGDMTISKLFSLVEKTGAIFNASNKTITLGGSMTTMGVSYFEPSTSTVKYTSSVNVDITSAHYYNLIIDHTGTTFTVGNAIWAINKLTVNAGTLNGSNKLIVINGSGTSFVINGTFEAATSTVFYWGGTSVNIAPTTYYNLKMNDGGGAAKTFTAAGDFTVNSQIIVDQGKSTFDASNRTVTLAGSGTPLSLVNGGKLRASTSTIKYTGSSATNVTAATYYNLILVHPNKTYTFLGNTTANGTFTDTSAPSTLKFNSGSTYNFNKINIAGSAGNLINLRSTGGSNWIFNPSSVSKADYLDVSSSTNSGVAFCATNSTDSGSNQSWNISSSDNCDTPTPTVPDDSSTPIVPDSPTPIVPKTDSPTPTPVSACNLENITGVVIDPAEVSVNPGQIQTLGIIFKDANGNSIARNSVANFKITPDYNGSFWKVDPGIGGLQSENNDSLQIRIVGGNTAGLFGEGLAFSACNGLLRSSAQVEMKGGSGIGSAIATVIDNAVLAAREAAESRAAAPITAAVAAATLAAIAISSSFPAVVSVATYITRIAEFFRYPAAFLGARVKRSKWGVVYDSVTKRPISHVRIQILSSDGRVRETQFSSESGTFGFLVSAGKYKIVAAKKGYIFPSNIMPGASDEQYKNVYHGKEIEIKTDQIKGTSRAPVNLSIPLDQTKLSTTDLAIASMALSVQRFLSYVRLPIMIIGTSLTVYLVFIKPNTLNFVFLAIYIALWVVEIRLLVKPRTYGTVKDSSGSPLGLAIVRALDSAGHVKATVISSDDGKFMVNIQPGTYYFDATRLGYKSSRSDKIRITGLGDLSKIKLELKKG